MIEWNISGPYYFLYFISASPINFIISLYTLTMQFLTGLVGTLNLYHCTYMCRNGCQILWERSQIPLLIYRFYYLSLHIHRLIMQYVIGRCWFLSCCICVQYFLFVLYLLIFVVPLAVPFLFCSLFFFYSLYHTWSWVFFRSQIVLISLLNNFSLYFFPYTPSSFDHYYKKYYHHY